MSLSMRPLSQNNCQVPVHRQTKKQSAQKARADSTGVENTESVKLHHSVKKPQTQSVRKRNARERNRVQGVNAGFEKLKTAVPHLKNKASKVDALKGAIEYIRHMKELLGEDVSDIMIPASNISSTSIKDDEDSSSISDCESHFSSHIKQETLEPKIEQKMETYSPPKIETPDILNQMVLSLPYSTTYDIYSPHTLPAVSLPPPSPLATLQPIPHKELLQQSNKLPSISSQLWWPQDSKALPQ